MTNTYVVIRQVASGKEIIVAKEVTRAQANDLAGRELAKLAADGWDTPTEVGGYVSILRKRYGTRVHTATVQIRTTEYVYGKS